MFRREFPEVPMVGQDPNLSVRFDDFPEWSSFQATIVTDMPEPAAWMPEGHRFGTFSIRNNEAYYVFRSNDLWELTAQRLCAYSKVVADVANLWKGQLDDFHFEKAMVLDMPTPLVIQARFWAYPIRGRNFRYLHLSLVQLKDEGLVDRVNRGKFAEWIVR